MKMAIHLSDFVMIAANPPSLQAPSALYPRIHVDALLSRGKRTNKNESISTCDGRRRSRKADSRPAWHVYRTRAAQQFLFHRQNL